VERVGVTQLGPATHLTPADVAALWVNAGGDPDKAPIAVGIVFGAENPAGNAGLVNDTPSTGDYSVGLWQINYYGSLMGPQTARFGSPEAFAADPGLQARAAIAMSQNGQNWQPWGPDLGYQGYGHPVPGPLPGSKVQNWLDANPMGSSPSWLLPVVATAIVAVSGAFAAWIYAGGGLPPFPRLPRFAFARENPAVDRDRDPEPMLVQSLLFPFDRYSVPQAKQWARRHGYRSSHVETTRDYIHLVQFDPRAYNVRVVRTVTFGKGIKAHVAREAA
jgi:hypothetical protein